MRDINKNNLINKVWNLADVLRQSGIAYTDYVAQITYMIFLKMEFENLEFKDESLIPDEYRWDTLLKLRAEDLEKHYNNILSTLSKKSGILGLIFAKAQNKIDTPVNLQKMITLINAIDWAVIDVDIKGEIYEGLLEKNATESKAGAGQYFTPRALIKAIVEIMKPQLGYTIMDPACGTGGFLIEAFHYIKRNIGKDKEKIRILKEETVFGVDITPLVVSLCAMNMYLNGIGANIIQGDSLLKKDDKAYNMILTNPPFGKKTALKNLDSNTNEVVVEKEHYSRNDFFASTSNKQINFLQHIMSILAINGKAAVVLPDNVLFEGGAGEAVRKYLLNNFNLHTILRLPTGIFYAQGVKANVLFFDRGLPKEDEALTKEVWIYDLRTNMNLSLKTNPLTEEHLEDFKNCFNADDITNRKETFKFKKFTYEEIIKRDKINLDIFWIKDESLENLDNLPQPEELLSEIKSNFEDAFDIFNKINI